jgi:Xaa-Pro aminopeptidase
MTARIDALRAGLAAEECGAFVSVAPPANQYLTGFRGSTSGLLVTAEHAQFFCDSRYTEQAGLQVTDCEVEEVKGGIPALLGARLKDLGCRDAAYDDTVMTVSQMRAVERGFEGELRALPQLVSGLRQAKSPEEVEQIRAAQALAEGVLDDVLDMLEEGIPEREVAARMEYMFQQRGASGASFPTIALFGGRSSLPHGEPGDTRLARGDIVLLDFGCRLDGYCSDLTRTFAFGTIPDAWFEEIYELTLTAQEIAIEAIRPGMKGREVDAVARHLIAEAGYGAHFGHGLGHGVGIEIHEGPRLHAESDTVLEPGMVVTVEPGIYLPGRGGVRIEDMVVVTGDGCRNLTSAPKEFKVLAS